MEPIIIYSLSIFLGLSIGSFLNVCRYRIPKRKSLIKPSSSCQNCLREINWYHNIPVISWLFLKGSCYYCKAKIPISYLLVEFLTAIIFVFNINSYLTFSQNHLVNIIGFNILSGFLILIALTDLQTMTIPNSIIIFGSLSGLLFTLISESLLSINNGLIQFLNHCLASFLGFLILEVVVFIIALFFKKQAFGMGDSKFVFLLGTWLGFKGMLLSLNLAIYIGGFLTLLRLLLKKLKRGQKIAFAPYLSVGAYLVCFYGEQYWITIMKQLSF
tara:strand:+ start:3993 stop:4808 length:816 start_codon:yes stop_codon:yes gene_type:complete